MKKIRELKNGMVSVSDYLMFLKARKVLTLKREKRLTHLLLERVFSRLLVDSKKRECSVFCLVSSAYCIFVEKYFFEIEVYKLLTSEELSFIREDSESAYVSAHVSHLAFGNYLPNRHLEYDEFFELSNTLGQPVKQLKPTP